MSADALTRSLMVLIALALSWLALRPHLLPMPADASREPLIVNLERVGGRALLDGTSPIRGIDRRP